MLADIPKAKNGQPRPSLTSHGLPLHPSLRPKKVLAPKASSVTRKPDVLQENKGIGRPRSSPNEGWHIEQETSVNPLSTPNLAAMRNMSRSFGSPSIPKLAPNKRLSSGSVGGVIRGTGSTSTRNGAGYHNGPQMLPAEQRSGDLSPRTTSNLQSLAARAGEVRRALKRGARLDNRGGRGKKARKNAERRGSQRLTLEREDNEKPSAPLSSRSQEDQRKPDVSMADVFEIGEKKKGEAEGKSDLQKEANEAEEKERVLLEIVEEVEEVQTSCSRNSASSIRFQISRWNQQRRALGCEQENQLSFRKLECILIPSSSSPTGESRKERTKFYGSDDLSSRFIVPVFSVSSSVLLKKLFDFLGRKKADVGLHASEICLEEEAEGIFKGLPLGARQIGLNSEGSRTSSPLFCFSTFLGSQPFLITLGLFEPFPSLCRLPSFPDGSISSDGIPGREVCLFKKLPSPLSRLLEERSKALSSVWTGVATLLRGGLPLSLLPSLKKALASVSPVEGGDTETLETLTGLLERWVLKKERKQELREKPREAEVQGRLRLQGALGRMSRVKEEETSVPFLQKVLRKHCLPVLNLLRIRRSVSRVGRLKDPSGESAEARRKRDVEEEMRILNLL